LANENLLNYNRNIGETTIVGSYPSAASPYGAMDLAGNVSEWVSDWYSETYYREQTTWNNPQGPSKGIFKVQRGGSWLFVGSAGVTSFQRNRGDPAYTDFNFGHSRGFRCALSEASP
jgi:formylglycine-generating enzyme required for sulfatase activity